MASSLVERKSFIVFSGANDRGVIAFLRALQRCGERASIIARSSADLVLRTAFRRDVAMVRDSDRLDLDVLRDSVARARAATGGRRFVVLPSSEFFNTFLLANRQEIEGMGCEIPLVDASLYATLSCKRSATDLFRGRGHSIPEEFDPATGLVPPVVAKPKVNVSASAGSLYPRLLLTREAIEEFSRDSACKEYFFQEFVAGESHYLLFHFPRSGDEPAVWSQRNLLQQPDGKSMLLAEPSGFHTSPTAGRLLECLRSERFHGIGMIEMIISGSREVFIEMNPRIWGPAQLCVDCGQSIMESFIGDVLFDQPRRFAPPGSQRGRYFWLGGLAGTLASRRPPIWHAAKQSLLRVVFENLRHDVYLRRDTWRGFLADFHNQIGR